MRFEMFFFFFRFYVKFAILVLLIPANIYSGLPTSIDVSRHPILVESEKTTLNKMIVDSSKAHGVDLTLVMGVIKAESNFDVYAVSEKGAKGLMQLMPITVRHLGLTDVRCVYDNIDGGVRYLAELLDKYKGNVKLTLAAYNAGPGRVKKYGGVPPYKETRAYIKNVLKFKGEYTTILKLKGEYLT